MKKIAFLLLACLAPASALAADIPARTGASAPAPAVSPVRSQFYAEGQIGAVMIGDVDTATYSGTTSGITYTNAKATFDYRTALALGAEIGMTRVLGTPFRVGLAYATFKAEVNEITGSGTFAYNGTTYNLSATVNRSQLTSSGLDFDNRVHVFTLNGYYDFDTGTRFRPFIGAGAGFADIKNATSKKLALNAALGFQYDMSSNVYLGAKLVGYRVSGPKDELGLTYKSITAGAALASVGVRF